jgi:hypothetical protein
VRESQATVMISFSMDAFSLLNGSILTAATRLGDRLDRSGLG